MLGQWRSVSDIFNIMRPFKPLETDDDGWDGRLGGSEREID